MSPASKPRWQQAAALVSLGAGGAVTGFSFVPGTVADAAAPPITQIRLLALRQAAQVQPGDSKNGMLRSAVVNVAQYYLRLAASKTPAEVEALIWQRDSLDGVDHGQSCAAFASLTLELAAQVVGQRSWVTGGSSYPWPLQDWADVRVDPNPDSLQIISVLQAARAQHRWRPAGDGYQPQPGDWVMFDGHVEVVTSYASSVLDTIGGDSLPNFSVNAHQYSGPLAVQGVTGFVDNGDLADAASNPGAGAAGASAGQADGAAGRADGSRAAIPGAPAGGPASSAAPAPAASSPASRDSPAGGAGSRPRPGGTPPSRARRYGRHQPAAATASPAGSSQQTFITAVAAGAIAAQRRYGVPAAVTIAQAIDESAWGQSTLASRDHNLFGIKGIGPAGSDRLPTQEYVNGQAVTVTGSFRVYRNDAESIDDHGRLLATSGYYRQAMSYRPNPNAFAAALTGVYATDPHYGAKIISLMSEYDLYRFGSTATAPAGKPTAEPTGSARPAIPGLPTAGPSAATPPGASSPGSRPASPTAPAVPDTITPTAAQAGAGRAAPSHGAIRPAPGNRSATPIGAAPAARAAPAPRPAPAIASASAAVPGAPGAPVTRIAASRGTRRLAAAVPAADAARRPGAAAVPGVPPVPREPAGPAAPVTADIPATSAAPPAGRTAAVVSPAPPASGGPRGRSILSDLARPFARATPAGAAAAHAAPPRRPQATATAPSGRTPSSTSARPTSAPQPSARAPSRPPAAGPTVSTRTPRPAHPAAPASGRTRPPSGARAQARPSRYRHQMPPPVTSAFLTSAQVPLRQEEALYRDVAGQSGIRWELLAACDWMQCRARPRFSPVHGEKLGAANPDGTVYRTRSEALEQCAEDLADLAWAVYRVDVCAPGALSVRDLANVYAAFRWGGLLKLHRTSAMEFPYSVAGLTGHLVSMRWPNIAEPNAPDRPGTRFRMPFGAVPVVLSLDYPAIA